MPFPSPSPSTLRRFRNIFQFPTVKLPGCPQSCSPLCMQEVSGKCSLSAVNRQWKKVPKKWDISLLCPGPVSSILVNRYGSRPVVMVGGVMVSAAMVLASFGTTIVHLYLCIGVIGGNCLFFWFFISNQSISHSLLRLWGISLVCLLLFCVYFMLPGWQRRMLVVPVIHTRLLIIMASPPMSFVPFCEMCKH